MHAVRGALVGEGGAADCADRLVVGLAGAVAGIVVAPFWFRVRREELLLARVHEKEPVLVTDWVEELSRALPEALIAAALELQLLVGLTQRAEVDVGLVVLAANRTHVFLAGFS